MRFFRTIFSGLLLISLATFGSVGDATAGEVSALDSFKARHGAVVKLVQERAADDSIQAQVDELLDYHALAETSLGGPRRYASRCEPRCADFEARLTELIRENYLRRIRTDKEYQLDYVGEDKRPRNTRVTTRITHKKEGRDELVEVVYVMHKVGDVWRVEDIITEGVSLAKNYKYEFNKILKDGGIDDLIARLDAKLAELAKKN